MARLLPSLGAILWVGAFGCADEPLARALSWSVEFADAADRDRARVVVTRIERGDCSAPGALVYEAFAVVEGTTPPPVPPALDPGTFSFRAAARDASCVVYAAGCEAVSLPAERSVVAVSLAPAASIPACSDASCEDGVCSTDEPPSEDAGAAPDACGTSCVGRECGDDGCGGSCGTCLEGTACQAGQCTGTVMAGACEVSCTSAEFCDQNQQACRPIPEGCAPSCECIARQHCTGASACTMGERGFVVLCL